MIKINLLPKEIQEKGKGIEWVIAASALMGMIVLTQWAYYLQLNHVFKKDSERKVRWSSQRDKLKSDVARVETLDQQKTALNAKKNTVVMLLQGRLLYPKMMEGFYETLPRDVWVTDLSLKEDGSKNIFIEANSNSLSVDSIADWLQTLEAHPEKFNSVSLSAIETKPGADPKQASTYMFKMSFNYMPGA